MTTTDGSLRTAHAALFGASRAANLGFVSAMVWGEEVLLPWGHTFLLCSDSSTREELIPDERRMD
jgi:hypothetical protein